MGKQSAPAPPNYGPIAQASQASAELSYALGKEQLDWARTTYANDKAVSDQVTSKMLGTMDFNRETAEKDRARYEQYYQPLEDNLVAEANDYASPGRKDIEIGRAQSGVAQQFEGARQAAQRELESFGINPSATRYAALDIGARTAEAAAKAAAGNNASRAVDDTARALRSEAINVGRGYPASIQGQFGTSMAGGQAGLGGQLNTTASGANTMGTAQGWQGLGNSALGVWGNTLNMGYQNQLGQFNANQNASSGFGSALGLIGGIATKAMFFEDGGPVPEQLSPSEGDAVDDVPAMLNAGEFIIPEDVVRWFGEKHFQKLIEKAHEEKGDPDNAEPDQGALPAQAAPDGRGGDRNQLMYQSGGAVPLPPRRPDMSPVPPPRPAATPQQPRTSFSERIADFPVSTHIEDRRAPEAIAQNEVQWDQRRRYANGGPVRGYAAGGSVAGNGQNVSEIFKRLNITPPPGYSGGNGATAPMGSGQYNSEGGFFGAREGQPGFINSMDQMYAGFGGANNKARNLVMPIFSQLNKALGGQMPQATNPTTPATGAGGAPSTPVNTGMTPQGTTNIGQRLSALPLQMAQTYRRPGFNPRSAIPVG